MSHKYYCGIDLHARSMYVCIIDSQANILLHRRLGNDALQFLSLIAPYRENIAVCCETCYNYYWLCDLSAKESIPFVLGHALYMRAIHGAKTKNDKLDSEKIARLFAAHLIPIAFAYPSSKRAVRDLLRRRNSFNCEKAMLQGQVELINTQYNLPPVPADVRYACNHAAILKHFKFSDYVSAGIGGNLTLIESYDTIIAQLEKQIRAHAIMVNKEDFRLLTSIRGIGDIIALTILYEMYDISRFESVGNFVSYSRLVKCPHSSAGKNLGYGNSKMGNPYLKWAFTEAAIHMARFNPNIAAYLRKLERKVGPARSKSRLAHKIGRAIFFILKNKEPFNEERFLKS
jgi:transposase